jgi:hypothetical protein
MSILTQIVEILENSGISYEISKNSIGISVNFSESLEISQEITETSTKASDYPPKPDGEGWISNQGNNACCCPVELDADQEIEIWYRQGWGDTGTVGDWYYSWKETENSDTDIVWFRVVK